MPFLSSHFLCVSSLEGLMQTSEHAVLYWAHLVFSSQVLDPDKERYDFQIQWKLKLEVRGEMLPQLQVWFLFYKIELHPKGGIFKCSSWPHRSCGKGLEMSLAIADHLFWPKTPNSLTKALLPSFPMHFNDLLSVQRSYKFIYKINGLSLTLFLVPRQTYLVSRHHKTCMLIPPTSVLSALFTL